MPQRAQLLLKLAQTAAKAGGQVTQVNALPKVAQDVYDTIREAQAANQHQQQQHQPQAPRLSSSTAMLPDGLLHSFGRLNAGRAQQAPLLPHSLPLHGSLSVSQPNRLKHQHKPAQHQQHGLVEEAVSQAPAQPVTATEVQHVVTSRQQGVTARDSSTNLSKDSDAHTPADASKAASSVGAGQPAASSALDPAGAQQAQQREVCSTKIADAASSGEQSAASGQARPAHPAAALQGHATPAQPSAPVEKPTPKQHNSAATEEPAKPISKYEQPTGVHPTYTTVQQTRQATQFTNVQAAGLDSMPWPAPGVVAGHINSSIMPATPGWSQATQYTPRAAAHSTSHAASVPRVTFSQPFVQQGPRQQHNVAQQMPIQRGPTVAAQQGPGQGQQQQQQQQQVQQMGRSGKKGNNVSLNKQVMAAYGVRELAALVRAKGRQFDFFNISSAVARVPKLVGANGNSCGAVQLDSTSKALVDDLAALMARSIGTFDARGLANAAWAFAKLRYSSNQRLPALIAEHAVPKMAEFSPQNLSNLLWACVYLHFRSETLLQAAAEEVVQKLGMFKPQELANALWAFASLDYRCPALLSAAAQRCMDMADAFKEQELSNIVWAFARMRYDEPRLRAALLYQVDTKLDALQPQGVANVAWALAASHTTGPDALPGSWGPAQAPTAGDRGTQPDVDGYAIDSSSWMGEGEVAAARQLLGRLVGKALPSLGFYDAQGLSNLVWAMGALGVRDGPAVGVLLAAAASKAERMGTQQLCNVLCGCAGLGWADGGMLAGWAQQVVAKADAFDGQALANSAWAFAQLGHHDAVLFKALAEAAASKVDSMTPAAAARMAWALSAGARCQQPRLHKRLMHQAAPAKHAVITYEPHSLWTAPVQLQHHQEQEQLAAYMPPPTPGQLHSAEHLQHLQQLASHFASPDTLLNNADSHNSGSSSGSNSMTDSFCMDSLYSADDVPVTPPQGSARRGLLHGGFGPFGVQWGAAGTSPPAAEDTDMWFGGASLQLYGM